MGGERRGEGGQGAHQPLQYMQVIWIPDEPALIHGQDEIN